MRRIAAMGTLLLSLAAATAGASDIRQPAVAGQFYPADRRELARMVDGFLSAASSQNVAGCPVALLSPHAGYAFSGQTAAFSYALLKNRKIDTVVLIGNSHHFYLEKGAVAAGGAFRTPLGDVPVNVVLARKILSKTKLLEENTAPHGPEHALEVQLPFLQRALGSFTVVPLLLGKCSPAQCGAIGKAVAAAIDETGGRGRTVIVASSDLSHYPSWANANSVDNAALKALAGLDPAALDAAVERLMASSVPGLSCVFCGKEALLSTMSAAEHLGAKNVTIMKHSTSGDTADDRSRVVGYGAAVFLRPENGRPAGARPAPFIAKSRPPGPSDGGSMKEFSVSGENQKVLLGIARSSIEQYLKTKHLSRFTVADPGLAAPAAVFVTLTESGQLRGCIGTTEPHAPLFQAVSQMALAAAVEDYRFPPVTLDELKDIRIEISVLSPMRQVQSADEVRQGTDGVVVRRNGRSGLFLPQVWEHFTRKDDFLNELCWQKAGLEPGAWKDKSTELYTFTVFAFEEPK